MKKKILIPTFLAALALPLALSNQSTAAFAEFIGEYSDRNAYIDYGVSVNAQYADEGFVLLKNDGTLPMSGEGKKITLAGKSSVKLAGGGAGSGSGSSSVGDRAYDMQKSLTEVGFELNPDFISFYKDDNKSGIGRTNGNDGWKGNSQVQIGETPLEIYGDELLATLDEYSDAAVQVITREGSEGCDVKMIDARDFDPRANGTNKSITPLDDITTKHALELSDNEEALLEELGNHTDHIIVVINSSNIFECEKLQNNPKVAAIIWIGNPGDVGAGAVGRIITGRVNPSGRTVDTWARSFREDPTFQNFSDNAQTSGIVFKAGSGYFGKTETYASQDTMFNADGTPTKSYGTAKGGSTYLDEGAKVVNGGINGVKPSAYVSYEEGIYLDYRYYETKYADMAKEDKAAADAWYDGEKGVLYPFGYGLSYTTFEQKVLRINPAQSHKLDENDDLIEVSVEVKNVGNVAGKDAVQVYWKAPYAKGGIEKADHVLCAFDKSKLLEPGESQVMHLTFHLQDVANYDFMDKNANGFKGYELDGGEYAVMLMKNAHEAYEEVKLNVVDGGIKYETDRFTGAKVENRFTDRGFYNSLPGENDVEFTQMSRADFEGTFPTHPTIESRTLKSNSRVEEYFTHEFNTYELEEGNFEYVPEGAYRTKQDAVDGGWEQPATTITKANGRMQLEEMRDLDWNDPKWNDFINQFTWSEMLKYLEENKMSSPSNSEIGKSGFSEGDGPQKFNIIWWVSSPIVAATFNPELAHKQGECVGMESQISGKAGWWGPGVNTHRSPFGGRNFEYYSADPFLMGRMAALVVGAATDRGVYAYFKHFVVNDQEKNRESGISYLTEQAFREIYLKSFQMVFEEGKSIGVMSSYNRIGLMETAASYPLLTEVLRGEWGFKGAVLSDMTHSGNGSVNFLCYENVNNRILSGCNSQLDSGGFRGKVQASWDANAFDGKGCPVVKNASGQTVECYSFWNAAREMIKGIMYMSIRCTGQARGLTQVVKTNELEFKVGDDVNYEVEVPSEYAGYTLRLNQRVDLPKGITFENGVLSGKFENVGLFYIDLIAEDGTNKVAVKLIVRAVPDMTNSGLDGGQGEGGDPVNPPKKKGCGGAIEATAAIIGLVTLAGVGIMLVSKKRKEQ